jgi:hypothetical protein
MRIEVAAPNKYPVLFMAPSRSLGAQNSDVSDGLQGGRERMTFFFTNVHKFAT